MSADNTTNVDNNVEENMSDYDPNYSALFNVNESSVLAVNESVVSNNVYLTLGYEDTDFTRKYKFANVDSGALSSVASKVLAYNANVPATDKAVFVSDDGDSMTSIVGATVEQVTTEYLIKR